MKCIYAIPRDAAVEARRLSDEYSAALSRVSDGVIELADDLRAFAEARSAAVIKLDDEDWRAATAALSGTDDRRLAGELFWSPEAAERIRRALDEQSKSGPVRAVAEWLSTQIDRERSMLLVAA